MTDSAPRILVIERDPMVQSLLRDILDADGYRTLVTANWLDPEDIRQLRPTAMLVDPLVDGDHGGWDYLRLLRAQPGMRQLPVIVCTANHEQLRSLTASELSLASDVVLKPFELDELLNAVMTVMKADGVAKMPWSMPLELPTLPGSD